MSRARVPVSEWKWFGHAAHLIVGHSCRFHLATLVEPWLVSTVGEYWPERTTREIHAKIHDSAWLVMHEHLMGDYFDEAYMERFGYEEIGAGRKYETMVFRTAGDVCGCGCGLPQPTDYGAVDIDGYNDAIAATQGHMALCEKWSAVSADAVETTS